MNRVETIGRATLYLGDCRDVFPLIPRVDLLVTSPPYNCGKEYGTADDSLPLAEFKALLRDGCFTHPARAYCINVGQYVGSRANRLLFRDLLGEVCPHPLIDEVIWDKGPANGAAWGNYPNSPRIRAQHESIFLFGDAKMETGNGLTWADWSRLTTSIWSISANVDLSIHPAMMPLAVAERCIRLWADVDGQVLDPFMGSGTTGVAAIKMGRDFIGCEIDPIHFETACRRIEQAQRQGDLFIEGAA